MWSKCCTVQIGLTNDELQPELEAQGVRFTALEEALRDLARNVVRAGANQVQAQCSAVWLGECGLL